MKASEALSSLGEFSIAAFEFHFKRSVPMKPARPRYFFQTLAQDICSITVGLFLLPIVFVTIKAQNIQNPQSAVDNLMRSSLKVDESTGAMQLQIPLGEYRGRGQASL